jgi:hypothetical protein
MDSQAIMTVSAATLALVQLLKRAGLPDRLGAVAVLALAALGVALWALSRGGVTMHDVWTSSPAGSPWQPARRAPSASRVPSPAR